MKQINLFQYFVCYFILYVLLAAPSYFYQRHFCSPLVPQTFGVKPCLLFVCTFVMTICVYIYVHICMYQQHIFIYIVYVYMYVQQCILCTLCMYVCTLCIYVCMYIVYVCTVCTTVYIMYIVYVCMYMYGTGQKLLTLSHKCLQKAVECDLCLFLQCSVTCGEGLTVKKVECRDQSGEKSNACSDEDKPPSIDRCIMPSCPTPRELCMCVVSKGVRG